MCYERRDPKQAKACFERDQRKVEYIEREALIAELAKGTIITDDGYCMGIMAGMDFAMKKVSEQPAADVVPVVRCKDCLYWQSGENECDKWEYCTIHNIGIGPHSFCSYGERKDGEG